MDQIFECVVHHAVDFSCFMDPDYVGPVETLDCDPDFFSYFALLSTLKSCGYVSLKSPWYHDPNMEDGFIPLNSDSGCRRMQSIALEYDRVHFYVVHPMSQPDIVALDPLLEYPCIAPPIPHVVNETNVGPNGVGPNGEGKDADSGPKSDVNGNGPELDLNDLGPMIEEDDLFGEHENGPGLDEGGHNGLGEDEYRLGNEEGDMNVGSDREDSALNVDFDDSDVEVCMAGNLDSEVGENEVNDITGGINANVTAETVNAETVFGEGSGVRENEATVNEVFKVKLLFVRDLV